MRGRREEQGWWWWKVFGYIQSQCAAFCVAFKVTKNGHGKRGVPFFVCVCFLLTSPSLYSWNWRPENTAAPGVLPTTPLFKVRPLLDWAPNPYLAVRLWLNTKYKNDYFTLRVFFFCFVFFKFQAVPQNKNAHTWTVCESKNSILSLKWFQELML